MRKNLLIAAVFVGGFSSLGIEMAASRLLGSVFGTSNLVWANIIGLILLYLTLGYFIGGRWADRSPYSETFYRIITWGGFTAGLVPIAAKPVLRIAAQAVQQLNAAVMIGSFISVLILFIIPITLLGTISPFAIRLSIPSKEQAGRVAGRMYAISTLGSILGTFVPVLILIPWIGTSMTFLVLSLLLLTVGILGLFSLNKRAAFPYLLMPIILIGASWFVLSGPLKTDPGQIFEDESQYNYIQVVEFNGSRFLLLNEGQAVHSVYNPGQLATFGTWDYFLAAPFFYPPASEPADLERLGIVGLAAGTISKQYTQVFRDVAIDGWEIDPRIIEVGREYFDMNEPNLNAIAADGRLGLERSQQRYSVIAVDAYRPPYIPWHLTTREFFLLVKTRLNENGTLVINVGRTPEDRRLIVAMVGTLQSVFPSVHVVDVPNTFNTIVYATVQPTEAENLRANLDDLSSEATSPFLLDVLTRAFVNLQPTPESEVVFTDDKAPIERLVNSIVLRYMVGDAQQFLPGVLQ